MGNGANRGEARPNGPSPQRRQRLRPFRPCEGGHGEPRPQGSALGCRVAPFQGGEKRPLPGTIPVHWRHARVRGSCRFCVAQLPKKKAEEKSKDKKGAKEKGAGEGAEEEERIREDTKIFIEVVEGKLTILAECPTPAAISHFVALISGYPKVKAVVRGGPDTFQAGSLLKGKNIPIILEPTIREVADFRGRTERTNDVLKCQALGLEVAFQAPGERDEQIHLFDYLNKLVPYGVNRDVLLKGVTIVPAKILGLDKQVGSLEKGKTADLIVFRDDPLESIPVIEKVLSGGRFVR